MAESTLNLTFDDYLGEVGGFLGWGRGAALGDRDWGTRKTAQLKDIVRAGLRKAYFPSVPNRPDGTYHWSFLRILKTLTLAEGETSVDLPSDFKNFEGPIALSNSSGDGVKQVWPTDEARIVWAEARNPSTTGCPEMLAEGNLKGTATGSSGRHVLRAWPIPDGDYTLKFIYHVLPDALISSHPMVYGGAEHAELFKYACLSVAEIDMDNVSGGPRQQAFERELLGSIGKDSARKAHYFGKNMDRSDELRDDRHSKPFTVTYDGVQY